MASTYTPDPTATQAPASQPDPDDFPLETLPSSGDGATAASIAQALKVLGDFAAWERKPRAKASQWEQVMKRYRDALLNPRFIIDHFGLPAGAFSDYKTDWNPRTPFTQTGIGGTQAGRWIPALSTAGTTVGAAQPGVSANVNYSDLHSTINLSLDGAGTGNKGEMRVADDSWLSRFTTAALLQLRMNLVPNNVTNVDWVNGFTTTSEDVASIAHGAFFISVNGGNWHARTITGGAPTDVDTGVAGTAGVEHDFHIVLAGSGVADDSTSRAIFLIDGVVKANITATLPIGQPMVAIFGGFTTGASGLARLLVGQVHESAITKAATP